jgi:hypothetical protein
MIRLKIYEQHLRIAWKTLGRKFHEKLNLINTYLSPDLNPVFLEFKAETLRL